MLNITEPNQTEKFPILSLGFRPFFLGAAGFAVIAILFWMYLYLQDGSITVYHLPPSIWHAHEMIYGYTLAVIAGFLLTAVGNWTKQTMPAGLYLLLLFSLWAMGRMVNLLADSMRIEYVAVLDVLFLVFLSVSIALPIIRTRQWQHLSIIVIVIALLFGNCIFYAGLLGVLPQGIYDGLYFGFYLTLTLIFIMARRVLPFFIEQGVGYTVKLPNYRWIDISCIALFVLFMAIELISPDHLAVSVLTGVLFFLHGFRLIMWHTSGIWKRPLLWSLYLGYACLVAAFGLKSSAYWLGTPSNLSVHAFAYGGIGMITLGMMSRISLGHTGRRVDQSPRILTWFFPILFIGALVRVVLPIIDIAHYRVWIIVSLLCWAVAFSLFIFTYFKILFSQKIA